MNILLGFGIFYGTGNIGDDLMLQGFLDIYLNLNNVKCKFTCVVPDYKRIELLKNRFPLINWVNNNIDFKDYDAWIGVGDTPIQITSGNWFLNYMNEQVMKCKENHVKMYMVGIGAEKEVLKTKTIYPEILQEIKLISTRDIATTNILTDLGYPQEKIITGNDLANYTLSKAFLNLQSLEERYIDIGVTVNLGDGLNFLDIIMCSLFIKVLHSRGKSIAFIVNEVRENKNFESFIYYRYFKPLYLFSKKKINLLVPNYKLEKNASDLVNNYKNIKCVISSRYHGVLTAAWSGSRVAAISRSKKVYNLAQEMKIPFIEPPVTIKKLKYLLENSVVVNRKYLESLSLKTQEVTGKIMSYISRTIA